MLQILDRVRWF